MEKLPLQVLAALFLVSATSCHSYINITGEEQFETYRQKQNVYAISLKTKQDSMVYFSEKYPGRIANGEVFGPRHVLRENFKPDSLLQRRDLQSPTLIKPLKSKNTYRQITQEGTRLVCNIADTTHIPLTNVNQVYIKKIDLVITIATITVFSGSCVGLIIYLVYQSMSDLSFDW